MRKDAFLSTVEFTLLSEVKARDPRWPILQVGFRDELRKIPQDSAFGAKKISFWVRIT